MQHPICISLPDVHADLPAPAPQRGAADLVPGQLGRCVRVYICACSNVDFMLCEYSQQGFAIHMCRRGMWGYAKYKCVDGSNRTRVSVACVCAGIPISPVAASIGLAAIIGWSGLASLQPYSETFTQANKDVSDLRGSLCYCSASTAFYVTTGSCLAGWDKCGRTVMHNTFARGLVLC